MWRTARLFLPDHKMWRWKPEADSLTQAYQLLPKIAGSPGTAFSWTLSVPKDPTNRKGKVYVVRFPEQVVIVSNGTPLEVDKAGENIIFTKFHLLKGGFDVHFEGTEFHLGENLMVRLGRVRRMQTVLCEFCQVRWTAWGSVESPGMTQELLEKLALPSSRTEIPAQLIKSNAFVPYGPRHLALQVIRLYEDETSDSGTGTWVN